MNLLRRHQSKDLQKKYILPAKLLPMIQQGEVIYVEFDEFIYFHFTFIKIIELLKAKGKPLVLHIRRIDNDIFSIDTLKQTISEWEAVDYILDSERDFTLRNSEESFQSNTYFFGKDINAHSQELLERRRSFYHTPLKSVSLKLPKYTPLSSLNRVVTDYSEQNKRVAIVTGVFDVVHPGHIRFLKEARKHADHLIVLINSDLSANHQPKNREHDRPVHRLHERVGVLHGLAIVDHIVPFDSDSAIPVLSELKGTIVYVKTVKDKERKSIQKEIALVKENGGKTAFIPNLRNKSGTVISSTMLIRACRQRAANTKINFHEAWSPLVIRRLDEITEEIKKWDKTDGKIKTLREDLRERYDGSLKTAIQIEQDVIDEIISLTSEIIHALPDKRDYYSYVIPYILGKMLDLPIKIVPVQYSQPGLPYGMINAVQRLGGKTVFFETRTKTAYKPFIFEEYYWKAMPHHTHFLARGHKKMFATRIYAYNKHVHFSSIGLKILFEEYQNMIKTNPKYYQMRNEIVRLFHKSLALLDELPSTEEISGQSRQQTQERVKFNSLPGIVAHGGAALLSPNDPRAENSASGIRHALKAGVDIVEIDVSVCKDGWIVSHDRLLDIGTTAHGVITDKTVNELRKVRIKLSNGDASEEKMITLEDALAIVSEERLDDQRPIYVKVDIKLSDEKLEKQFIKTLKNADMPLDKILVTTQLIQTKRRLKSLCPELTFEFNTVESNLYVLAYQLIQDEFSLDLYSTFLSYHANLEQARTVSLAQFVIENIGEELSKRLIAELQLSGFQVQAWVAASIREYLYNAELGVDFVLIQNPRVIHQAIKRKKNHQFLSSKSA